MLPIKSSNVQSVGNAEVVVMLEQWLERAKHGRIAFAVIVACEHPLHVVNSFAGSHQLMYSANWGLDVVKLLLQEKAASRHMVPESLTEPGSDRVVYNVTKGPACYDFIAWGITAKMNMLRAGLSGPLKVCFKMVDTPEEHEKHAKLRQKFYDGVIIPSLPLLGAVEDNNSADAPELERYTLNPIVEFAKAGEEVPLLTPSAEGVKAVHEYLMEATAGQAPITITLREAPYWENRNSNMTEWLKVAEYLENQGERVIFLRDTDKAMEPITGFDTCPAAALDVDIRLALYEAAKCNLFVSNGPWSLALFGTKPWLMMVELSNMSAFFPETAQFWQQWHGIDPKSDEQFPWSKPTQRIIWKRDNADNIIEAWEKLKPLLDEGMQQAAE